MRIERIAIDPVVATRESCIHNPRVPVSRLLGMLESGETKESIPKLEALRFCCSSKRRQALNAQVKIGFRSGTVAILLAMLAILAACTQKPKTLRVGITQIASNLGIDAVRKGFLDEMVNLGYREGQNIQYE